MSKTITTETLQTLRTRAARTGDRRIICRWCGGDGWTSTESGDCRVCKGEGMVKP